MLSAPVRTVHGSESLGICVDRIEARILDCEQQFTMIERVVVKKQGTEIRQEQLIQAALSLIAAKGLAGLSVARVARRAGLVPSAIYRHFSGKDALIDAVIGSIRQRLHGNITAIAGQTPDAVEQLHRLLMAHVRVIRENEGILRIVFSDELHRGQAEQKAHVHEMVTSYLKKVAAIVSKGQRAGNIRKDVDPKTVAVMFLGLIQPASILWHLSGGDFDVTKQAERAWPIFLSAIEPR
jgi:AcrR family transcriptional regulator